MVLELAGVTLMTAVLGIVLMHIVVDGIFQAPFADIFVGFAGTSWESVKNSPFPSTEIFSSKINRSFWYLGFYSCWYRRLPRDVANQPVYEPHQ